MMVKSGGGDWVWDSHVPPGGGSGGGDGVGQPLCLEEGGSIAFGASAVTVKVCFDWG